MSLELLTVPAKSLHANPWNPNRMDERTLQAERESIEAYGFIDPITVRPHPKKKDAWQIIDGEHRWKVVTERGDGDVPIIVLRDLSDEQAKKLTVILNETRGRPDEVALAQLLSELQASEGDALATALPYSKTELDHLLALASEDWDDFARNGDANKLSNEDEWMTITMRVPREFEDVWKRARELVAADIELHATTDIGNGQALELLAASFLASA